MMSLSRFISTAAVGIAIAGACLLSAPTPSWGQQQAAFDSTLAVSDSALVLSDSIPPIERARQYLIAREFESALEAAEEAALQLGLDSAAVYHAGYLSADEDTSSVHLYRGLALELLRRFPEARADYDVVLATEPNSWRARQLRIRYPYVSGQSLRSKARVLRDDGVVPDIGIARHGVGAFPLYNASSILVMSQVSFGLTGVLNNGLGILDHFSDQSLPKMPYWETRLLLDEILPEEVYGEGASVDVGSLARGLEVQFLTSGILDEVSGSLTGEAKVGAFSDQSIMSIEDLQASYTAVGLLDLQRSLILTIADSIQAETGFEFVPSREAFADSIESFLIDDVGRLLTYGFALEQLLLGEIIEAQALMSDLPDLVAQFDLEQLDEIVAHSTPPVDNLLVLTAISEPVAAVEPTPTVGVPQDSAGVPVPADIRPDVDPAELELRRAHVLSAAASRSLGGYSIWGPTVRSIRFDNLQRGDSRTGVAGTLDPTRSRPEPVDPRIPVDVVIPLPTQPALSPVHRTGPSQ